MIKRSIHQEDIKIINIYELKIKLSKQNKYQQNGREKQFYNKSRRLQYLTINNGKKTDIQNSTLKIREYMIFFSTHETFSGIYILGHERSLNKFKNIEIVQNTLSYGMKLDINSRKRIRKSTNMCK